jgi:hypothetical protein
MGFLLINEENQSGPASYLSCQQEGITIWLALAYTKASFKFYRVCRCKSTIQLLSDYKISCKFRFLLWRKYLTMMGQLFVSEVWFGSIWEILWHRRWIVDFDMPLIANCKKTNPTCFLFHHNIFCLTFS